MKLYPEQDVEDELAFPTKLAAPITETLSYGFTAEKATLTSGGGKSIDVLRVRPTSAWTGKRTAASEKPFSPRYHRGRAAGVPKNLICLHFTAGGLRGSLGSLVKDGRLVGVPFMVGRTGTIYELHEDDLWGYNSDRGNLDKQTVAIEIINVGPLDRRDDGFYSTAKKFYCGLDDLDHVHHLPVPFRGYSDFATFSNEQYDAVVRLLTYLTDKYNIPYEFLPLEKRFDHGAVPSGWRGIASHVNFAAKGKWDIGPAFEWDRLTQRSLSLPVAVTKVGGAPAPAGGSPPPPDKVAEELQITRAALDRLYGHTETDTANKGGSYPVGLNTLWHGGVHLFVDGADVHACLDGQIVAARLRTPPLEGGERPDHYGSGAFILVRHTLDLGLVGQLDKLLVPQAYTVQKPGPSAPGVDFKSATPFPDAQFWFEPGDVFVRTDEEDARPPRSEKAACPARVKSLTDFVEQVQGFEVRSFLEKDDVHSPTLTVTSPAGAPAFPLRRGDQLKLLDRPANVDLRRRALKTGTEYEVELVGLGDEMATVRRWKVKSTWFVGFRTEEGASPPGETDTDPTKDDGRHPDLAVGDVLEAVNPDLSVEGEPEGEIEVEVVSLGPEGKDIESITITKGLVRPLLSSSEKDAPVALKLVVGDELTLVQREARVDGKKLDLVTLRALAPEPKVAEVGDSGTVKAKKLALLEDPRKGAKVVATLSRRATFRVTQADAFPWIEIESGDETGWIEYKKDRVDLALRGRDEVLWTAALVGQSFFVKAFTDGELKAATPAAARALEVGTKGWIKVPDKRLEASGDSRRVKHADKLGHRGTVSYDPALLEPTGKNRLALYGSVVGTTGQLTYDADAMVEIRGIRRPLARLAGKPFYSLYMHLDDQAPLTQDALAEVAWFPREVTALRLKQPATWQPEKGRPVPLVAGDKLRPERPWLSDEPPADDQKFVWEEIQEGDIVTTIEVKATRGPIFLYGPGNKERSKLTLLMPGDKLVPVSSAASYKKNEWVEVRVEKLHAWQTRRAAPTKEKRHKLWNDNGTAQIGYYTPSEDLTEMGAQGGRSWVRVMARKNPTGWTATRLLGPPTGPAAGAPSTGFIKWSPDAFEPTVETRTAVYAEHKGARGTVTKGIEALLAPGGAEREQAPSRAIISRLEKAEVVLFPLADAGSSTSATLRVRAAQPLWKSGTYAPVLPREEPNGPRGKLIHWEIFSEENLLPSRPFRPDDKELWKKIGWPFWEAADEGGDWTMDCKEILALVAKGIPESDDEQDREKIAGEILNPKEIESLYTRPDVAQKLRHLAAKFTLEWAVDARTGLRKMKNAEIDQEWWGQLGQRFAGGPIQEWSQHVDGEWADRQARYFAPLLWWRQTRGDDRGGGLPGSTLVWHYNPIAFLEAFSAGDLAKQKAKEEAAAKAAKAKEEAARAKAAAKKK